MNDQQQVKQQFWSIERAVAFVVGPIVTPLSGALALWLGRHFPGVHVSSTSIAAFATGTAVMTGGGFIKWLDGRQKFTQSIARVEHMGELVAAPVWNAIPATERQSLLGEMHSIAETEITRLRDEITSKVGGVTTTADASADWNTPDDPAPAPEPGTVGLPPPPVAANEAVAGAVIEGS